MEHERFQHLLRERDALFTLMKSRGLPIGRDYNVATDQTVMRTCESLLAESRVASPFGVKVYDLTGLPEKEKESIALMGWVQLSSGGHKCVWCGKTTDLIFQDKQCGVMGCSVDCLIWNIVFMLGLFKTRTQLKSFIRKGERANAKKPARVRLARTG